MKAIVSVLQFLFKVPVSLSLLIIIISCNSSVREDNYAKKPNVLFIIVDDLRPQLGCYGKSQINSPNIDKLASQGMIFDHAYCQVPVCGASRASLLTGLRPTRKRFTSFHSIANEDAPGIVGLPKHFKENGYHTISNGKVYHHYEKDGSGGWSEPPWHPNGWVEAPWYPKGNWANYITTENLRLRNEFTYGHAFEDADVPDSAYFDGATARKTISDLRRLKEMDKPFFLAAGFRKPHLPFNAPKKYWNLYEREKIDLTDNPFKPDDAPEASLTDLWELNNYVGIPEHGPVPDSLAKTLIHGYYACISYID
ncbi:MAG: sulfatase-like hydrolase/transferase, partial [Cyclobacteriaceae bacterium]|nr:sulfatase-like hydrolase/transferase [Cyclobacteriaceae bacterium]